MSSVDHPEYYRNNGIECIDYIASCGWIEGFCCGNIVKYVSRAGKKDPAKKAEDLRKAEFYLKFLIDYTEGDVK